MTESRSAAKSLTVEDVFSMLSTEKAHDENPRPPPQLTLTPRSAEACLRHGIDPLELRIRDLDSFWHPGIDPAIQRMRHEAYSQQRHELMRAARNERKKLIKSGWQEQDAGAGSPERATEQLRKLNSTAVEAENVRIAKMQARQQKEIEQMLAYEMRMARMQEEANHKIEEEKRREEERRREEQRRHKLMNEQRRQREMRKRAEAGMEEKRRRELAYKQFLKVRVSVGAASRAPPLTVACRKRRWRMS